MELNDKWTPTGRVLKGYRTSETYWKELRAKGLLLDGFRRMKGLLRLIGRNWRTIDSYWKGFEGRKDFWDLLEELCRDRVKLIFTKSDKGGQDSRHLLEGHRRDKNTSDAGRTLKENWPPYTYWKEHKATNDSGHLLEITRRDTEQRTSIYSS